MVSHRGHHGVCLLYTLHEEEEKSQSQSQSSASNIMIWKAADQQAPPKESTDITHFGWEIRDSVPTPIIAQGGLGPDPYLCDVIHCACRTQGKKCSTEVVAATKNISQARLTATALSKTAAAIYTRRHKHKVETSMVLRWRMLKRRICKMRVDEDMYEGGG